MKKYMILCCVFLSACFPMYVLAPNMSGYIVRIESDVAWEGVVNDTWVSGVNTLSIPVTPQVGRVVCWDIRKSLPAPGLLRVFMTYRDYHTGSTTHPRWGDDATVSILGRIRGCSSGW